MLFGVFILEFNTPTIETEKDLQEYEDYLKKNFPEKNVKNTMLQKPIISNPRVLSSPVFSGGYLRQNIGKLLKVESLIGNILDTRIGILLDVGADFIAIKINKSCCSLIIPTMAIKYITIIHDNDTSKLGL